MFVPNWNHFHFVKCIFLCFVVSILYSYPSYSMYQLMVLNSRWSFRNILKYRFSFLWFFNKGRILFSEMVPWVVEMKYLFPEEDVPFEN